MNWKVVSFGLIVLLISFVGFGVYEILQNQQLAKEVASQKKQLDTTAEELRQAEAEKQRLETELSQTQAEVTELQTRVQELENKTTTLEQEIEKLREQLKQKNYITVGLSFIWNPAITYLPNLHEDVDYMNDEYWDRFQVLFFVYHAEPQSFIPLTDVCGSGSHSWLQRAWNAYKGPDIPVAIVRMFGEYDGCQISDGAVQAIFLKGNSRILFVAILVHEILHIFHFTHEVIGRMGVLHPLPDAWATQIIVQAKSFQMTPSSD